VNNATEWGRRGGGGESVSLLRPLKGTSLLLEESVEQKGRCEQRREAGYEGRSTVARNVLLLVGALVVEEGDLPVARLLLAVHVLALVRALADHTFLLVADVLVDLATADGFRALEGAVREVRAAFAVLEQLLRLPIEAVLLVVVARVALDAAEGLG